jgi:thiol-disulfide isomerase/thioredoxin
MEKKPGWSVRKIAKEIIIGLLILFVASEVISYLRRPDLESQRLPAIKAKLLNGSRFEVPKGKPLLIYFWGSWCPVCKLEAPNIQRVSKKYDVLTIAVNSGGKDKIQSYMNKYQLDFNVLNDQDGVWAKQFKVDVFPTIFIYDSEGELRFTEVGYTTTAGLLARLAIL